MLSFLDHAEEYLAAVPGKQAVLAFAAGSFIAFGAVLSVFLTVGVSPSGVARLLLGLGFAAGFTMVILSGAALFTEINVLLPTFFLDRRSATARLVRFWMIVYVGNLAGALFVGAMIDAGHVLGPEQVERLREIIVEKTRFHDEGTAGWFAVVASGVLGNWLVGMAAFIAAAARTVPGKILGILFPIVTFVALGVQHGPANMGYFAVGLIHGETETSWGEAFAWNLAPATLGNILGGAILVALLFWYTFGSDPRRRSALLRAQELVREDGGR